MKTFLFPLCALLVGILSGARSAQAQSIYEPYYFGTLAGIPTSPGSEDGSGRPARFNAPASVAVDSAGNIYVADLTNDTIRKITPAGAVSTLAGLAGSSGSADGTGSAARFSAPRGVAVDISGNVYVGDSFNHTIRKITPAGEVSTLAGLAGNSGSANGTGSAARFNIPKGVAVDGVGNVYVADQSNHTIRKITPAAVVTTLAGLAGSPGSANGTGSTARFNFPVGVAVDTAGSVYVADKNNHLIRKITSAGVVTTLAGLAGSSGSANGTGSVARFNAPAGVEVDSAGIVYVGDTVNHTIRKITSGGVVTTLAGLAGSIGSVNGTGSVARFNAPEGLAVDSAGNLYVADKNNHLIRKITPAAVVSTQAGADSYPGSEDGSASAARFATPYGLAVDGAGNLYVADTVRHIIRKITPADDVTTLAGLAGNSGSANGTGSAARFTNPQGVAVDSGGNIFVADTVNHTIRKITPAGVVSTFGGLAGSPGSADGTGSAARFNGPAGVGVDSAGNVYVADTENHTIRKITPAGAVTTYAGLAGSFGSANGVGSTARFARPTGVAVDSAGNLYVADSDNDIIRKINPARSVTTLAGLAGSPGSADGTGSAARFKGPYGVAVDSTGNVYVADETNSIIRKITPGAAVTTLAGLPFNFGAVDGAGSAARFFEPLGVAVDGAGNLYVADTFNHTIRDGRFFSLIDAASSKTHGAAGVFDIDLALAGTPTVECRSGGANGTHTLLLTFNTNAEIVSGTASVTFGAGSVSGITVGGNTLSVNLTGVINAQTTTVSLTNVTDGFGQVLPNASASASFLLGDTTGNRSVNASDISQTKAFSGQATDATNFRADVNVSGSVNASDIGQVKAMAGTSLPP